MNAASIHKELQALRALGAEVVERTSRLEEELVPFKARTPRKGRVVKKDKAQLAVDKRNRRIIQP